ncbi:hypothetical protein [Anatilimnocola floriformis]|uniref:hypothetical protein n=1 Tax=Anatilimnocola floriformis TaxID=2948575 RepID=UPI0020C40587|nr:hypothetical protein [Anatilimnocola floriformis]
MVTRRNLIDGLKDTPAIDPNIEKQFVYSQPTRPAVEKETAPKLASGTTISRQAISTRMRTDLAEALKRASLQRQLEKVSPNTLTEILEAAIEPWLKEHGYLD